MLRTISKIARRFSKDSNSNKRSPPIPNFKLRQALLIPSKTSIFPFQTHMRVISEDDGKQLKDFGFDRAVSSVVKSSLEDLPQETLDLIKESKQKAESLISEQKKERVSNSEFE